MELRTTQTSDDFASQFNLKPLRNKLVRINARAIRVYIPQTYPGKAHVFQSRKGHRNPLARNATPHLGWGAIAKGGVESYMIPGDHLQMLDEPNVRILAAQIQVALDKAVGV